VTLEGVPELPELAAVQTRGRGGGEQGDGTVGRRGGMVLVLVVVSRLILINARIQI